MSVLAAFSLSSQTPMWLALAMRLKRPLVCLAVLLAIAMALLPLGQAQADERSTAADREPTVERPMPAQQMDARPSAFPEVGRYLFGQVPQRDQLGQGYIILENTGDQIFGALYYPSSSFDCFRGTGAVWATGHDGELTAIPRKLTPTALLWWQIPPLPRPMPILWNP